MDIRLQFRNFLACAQRTGFHPWLTSVDPHGYYTFLTSLFSGFEACQNGGFECSKPRCFLSLLSPCHKGGLSRSLPASLWKPLFFNSAVFVWNLESTVYGSDCLKAVIAPKLSLCGSVNFLGRSLISSLRTVFCFVIFPGVSAASSD